MALNVLLVEDDKYLNKLMTDRLKLEGLRVEAALDGLSAKKILESDHFQCDVLICDILLPRMTGFALLEEFKSKENLRRIAISGIYTDKSKVQEIKNQYQLESYWTKPFELETFIAAVTGQELTTLQQLTPSGELHRRPIETLFLEAYDHAFTGRLVVKNGDLEKRIFFTNGFPVSAESTAMSESLGRSLVTLKVITDEVREEASRLMVSEKTYFGQTLIKMGALSKNELFQGLRKHSYRLLVSTLQMRHGKFEFFPMEKLPDHVLRIEFNPILLMLRAQASQVLDEALVSIFETKMTSYILKTDRYSQILSLFNLKEETHEFLKKIRPDIRFQELIAPIPPKNRFSAYRIFYLMESLGLIQWLLEPTTLKVSEAALETDFKEEFQAEHLLPAESQKELQNEYVDFLNKNYFETLNVNEEASTDEVRSAYEKIRQTYQPQNYGPLSGESKRILDDILTRIDQAFQNLSDPNKRKEYESLIGRIRADSALNSKRFLEAQDNFYNGEILLKKNQFNEAQAVFEKAHQAWPQNFEYHLYAKYAQFRSHLQKETGSENLLIQDIREIAYANASSDMAFLVLGYAYQALHKKDPAREAFQRALKNNENCMEASNALMTLAASEQKDKQLKKGAIYFYKLVKPIIGLVILSIILFVLYDKRDTIWHHEEGIQALSPDLFKPDIPSLSVRLKKGVAKVIVQKDWISSVPVSVLKSKCNQALRELQSYGIMKIYFYDQEQGLKVICRENKITRF